MSKDQGSTFRLVSSQPDLIQNNPLIYSVYIYGFTDFLAIRYKCHELRCLRQREGEIERKRKRRGVWIFAYFVYPSIYCPRLRRRKLLMRLFSPNKANLWSALEGTNLRDHTTSTEDKLTKSYKVLVLNPDFFFNIQDFKIVGIYLSIRT